METVDWDFNNLTQQQLAEVCDVDRTTIRNWQNAGMPYSPPKGKGHTASYCSAVCIHWCKARQFFKDIEGPAVPPAALVAFGWLVFHPFENVTKKDRELLLGLMKKCGMKSDNEAYTTIGYALSLLARYTTHVVRW